MREMLRKIWRGEGFPEEWREGLITPIHKKETPEMLTIIEE